MTRALDAVEAEPGSEAKPCLCLEDYSLAENSFKMQVGILYLKAQNEYIENQGFIHEVLRS